MRPPPPPARLSLSLSLSFSGCLYLPTYLTDVCTHTHTQSLLRSNLFALLASSPDSHDPPRCCSVRSRDAHGSCSPVAEDPRPVFRPCGRSRPGPSAFSCHCFVVSHIRCSTASNINCHYSIPWRWTVVHLTMLSSSKTILESPVMCMTTASPACERAAKTCADLAKLSTRAAVEAQMPPLRPVQTEACHQCPTVLLASS